MQGGVDADQGQALSDSQTARAPSAAAQRRWHNRGMDKPAHWMHTPEPEPGSGPDPTPEPKPKAPPVEDERGPQAPVREPGGGNPPERVQ